MKFFVWVISREEPPYIIKLHIQAKHQGEITKSMVIVALKKQCKLFSLDESAIEVRHFAQRNQFKVFIELNDRQHAIKLFERLYQMPNIPFY